MACPKCGAVLTAEDRFCPGCGTGIAIGFDGGVVAQDPLLPPSAYVDRAANELKMGRARKWLFWIALLTLVASFIVYAMQSGEVEKQIQEAEAAAAGMDPVLRDELMQRETGMTFQQAIDHDRGMVKILLVVNIVLAGLYFVMWWWARKNVLAAATTALLLYLTTFVVNGVIEPQSLAQGWLLRIFFIAALAKAIGAAMQERKHLRAS